MMKRLILIGALAGWMLTASSAFVYAFPVILDSTNGYSVTIEPGATLIQGTFQTGGGNYISGLGIQFAIGNSSSAVFPGIGFLGTEFLLDGNRPRDLVQNAVPFTLQVTSNNHLYDAQLLYFFSLGAGGIGQTPDPNNFAGAVFNLQGPVGDLTATPEPATLLLVSTTAAGLGFLARRRRKTPQTGVTT